MKSKIVYAALFCLAYGMSLLIIIPASFVSSELEKSIDGVTFYGVEGSLWSGELRALEVNGTVLKELKWSLSPFALLLGSAQLQLSSNSDGLQSSGTVDVDLFSSVVTLRDVRVKFPVDEYARQFGLSGFDLTGDLELKVSQLTYQDGVLSDLLGVMVWSGAGVSGLLELGDLQADLTQNDGALSAALSDREGPIKLDGSLLLQGSGHYQLNSTLGARDNSDLGLKQTLRLMGRKVGDNRVEVSTKGNIRLPVWLILG